MARVPGEKRIISGASDVPPRSASRQQKREIMDLLNGVYDRAAGRYSGGETDKTVAEAIGGGVLSGWVAEIRDEWFGPDGGNDEMVALRAELDGWRGLAERLQADAASRLADVQQLTLQVAAMAKRLDAIGAAVGPKARV